MFLVEVFELLNVIPHLLYFFWRWWYWFSRRLLLLFLLHKVLTILRLSNLLFFFDDNLCITLRLLYLLILAQFIKVFHLVQIVL